MLKCGQQEDIKDWQTSQEQDTKPDKEPSGSQQEELPPVVVPVAPEALSRSSLEIAGVPLTSSESFGPAEGDDSKERDKGPDKTEER